jgi:hypothetical protein
VSPSPYRAPQEDAPRSSPWHPRTIFLALWSGFNAVVLALVVGTIVSTWPPRGTVGDYYAGPGEGLLIIFFVMVPGSFVFLVNSGVLLWIAAGPGRRLNKRLWAWWGLVVSAWIVAYVVVGALGPSGRELPP